MLQLWLGGLTALVLGLAAFSVFTAVKARGRRMASDQRIEQLGTELFAAADALNRRCDDLRREIDRLAGLGDRLRLLELEREVAALAADGELDSAAAGRLAAAVAALRADLAAATES